MAISDSDLLQEYERFKALRERNAAGPAMIGGRDRAAYMRQYYEENKDLIAQKKRSYEARGLTRGERIKEIQRKYAGEGGIV